MVCHILLVENSAPSDCYTGGIKEVLYVYGNAFSFLGVLGPRETNSLRQVSLLADVIKIPVIGYAGFRKDVDKLATKQQLFTIQIAPTLSSMAQVWKISSHYLKDKSTSNYSPILCCTY